MAALRRFNATRHLRERCGAKRKRDGLPCRVLAMANGRCRFHGGRTPHGEGWHRTRWPAKAAPDAERKLARKIRDAERAARQREKRLAAMSPADRQRYEAWRRSHEPGPAAARQRRRDERRQNAELRARLEKSPRALDSAELASLRAERERLEQRLSEIVADNLGVFG